MRWLFLAAVIVLGLLAAFNVVGCSMVHDIRAECKGTHQPAYCG